MKTLYLVEEAMGVGKRAVSKRLKKYLNNSDFS